MRWEWVRAVRRVCVYVFAAGASAGPPFSLGADASEGLAEERSLDRSGSVDLEALLDPEQLRLQVGRTHNTCMP